MTQIIRKNISCHIETPAENDVSTCALNVAIVPEIRKAFETVIGNKRAALVVARDTVLTRSPCRAYHKLSMETYSGLLNLMEQLRIISITGKMMRINEPTRLLTFLKEIKLTTLY